MNLLWAIVLVIFVLWAAGFGFHVGGDFIHLLLLVVVALIVYNVLAGRSNRPL